MLGLLKKIIPEGGLVSRYRHWRAVGKKLNDDLVHTLDTHALQEGARRLKMLRRDTLVFDSEDQMSVLMEYCIYHVLRDGQNAVERYAAGADLDPKRRTLLDAYLRSRYSLFRVEKVRDGQGIEARDILRGDSMFVADVNLSLTGQSGMLLATRMIELDEFWMTGGAVLPVTGDACLKLQNRMQAWSEANEVEPQNWSRAQEARFVAMVIRACLHELQDVEISYEDPDFLSEDSSLPRQMPAKRETGAGRNDPCPCGSGKKHKKCCGV